VSCGFVAALLALACPARYFTDGSAREGASMERCQYQMRNWLPQWDSREHLTTAVVNLAAELAHVQGAEWRKGSNPRQCHPGHCWYGVQQCTGSGLDSACRFCEAGGAEAGCCASREQTGGSLIDTLPPLPALHLKPAHCPASVSRLPPTRQFHHMSYLSPPPALLAQHRLSYIPHILRVSPINYC
jgi:hypothetical protein